MTLRDHYTPDQHRAARILDAVKAGVAVTRMEIVWALHILGETIAE